ncbi:MAG: BamA/TamA family outer membrane protein [Bacteroidaceae bacterium]|nr:BamA/TamA family outer membrane protein [Bacteroidaceae bacterium]
MKNNTFIIPPLERGKGVCEKHQLGYTNVGVSHTPLNPLSRGEVLLVLFCLLLASCSTTKNLPEGEVLYTGIDELKIVNEDKTDAGIVALEEVEAALAYAPNNAIFGSSSLRWPLPVGLWVYNGFEKYQDKKGLGRWIFDHMGTNPVLMSTVNGETRAKVATNLLHDYGYFNGSVSYEEVPQKDPKKAKVSYVIDMARPYFLDSITYLKYPTYADSLIQATRSQSVLKPGDNFSVIKLEEERQRISNLLRNHGYYYYRPELTTYRADTLQKSGYVSLQVVPQTGIPAEAKKQYYIGKTSVYLTGYNGEAPTDTLQMRNMTLYYSGKRPYIRPSALFRNFFFKRGELFSQDRQTYTQEAVARMGVFKYSEFRYALQDTTSTCDTLDVKMYATFDKPYDAELELNVTSKSTDQTGPGAVFKLTRNNFKRMGADLSFELRGSYEWQTNSTVEGNSSKLNSYEIGTSLALNFPRLILPWKDNTLRRSRFSQHTSFKLYINLLNRARFFNMLSFGGTVAYDFRRSRTWKHTITPFQLTFNTLQSTTARFDSITAANPSLALSLGNQFIPSMNYTFTYDNARLNKRHNLWWETSITSAGNVTSLIYAAFGKGLSEKNKKLLNSPYAQFLKLTSEVRTLFKVGNKQHIATRLMGGVLWAYGNQTIAPYSEQFYIGGANSLRAFTVRSLGPGTYSPGKDAKYGYLDQTGDIKLEANIEYRFPIFGDLYGAAFLDAGNVWLMRKDESRPGGELTLKDFAKSIALGTGAGIRYDMDFLVIRLDLGVALHAPYDTGKRGYYNIPKFKDGLGLHFAIGYPF